MDDIHSVSLSLQGEGELRAAPASKKGEGAERLLQHATQHTTLARNLREHQTDAEQKLWLALRDRRLQGYKFRRQQPIGQYIADFLCTEAKLIIELDGSQHMDNQDADEKRSAFLRSQGFTVLRFWNNEVLQNLEGVLTVIADYLAPSPNPLPQGEGLIEPQI